MKKTIAVVAACAALAASAALGASGDQGKRLSPPFCISLKTGVVRSVAATAKCKPGERRATGLAGAAGAPGPQGATGATGAKGDPGATGARGPAGPAGAGSPLVFGPYNSGSQDSSVCGGDWATDTYTRTYTVTPRSDGSFDVSELYQGTFVTLAGPSPASCEVQVAAGITGTFYGDEAGTIPAPADFNFTAVCPPGCTGDEFAQAFFGTSWPSSYAWQFHYTTPSNGSWDNTDHGNSGNIS